jgi:holliday junction DNA helicase RuvA
VIAFLHGALAELEPTHAVIDCAGIGYLVKISLNTHQLIQGKKEVRLFTHFMVREDAQILFGFAEKAERTLFEHLVSVSGVGGNTALAILSSTTAEDLYTAIANEDAAALRRVKGIGAKTAGRIILELKDKLKLDDLAGSASPRGSDAQKSQEASLALINLGFTKQEVNKRLEQIFKKHGTDLTTEQIIKLALRN